MIVAALAILDACSGSGASVDTPTPSPATGPTQTSAAPSASPGPSVTAAPSEPAPGAEAPPAGPALTGFAFPIAGACLPGSDNLLPNAPREYRAGVHEGIDFYPGTACASIAEGTPVLAARSGLVVRADWNFVEMTPEKEQELEERSQAQGFTDAEALDLFRGRQVWIDHGGGVVTRYAHLGEIAPGVDVGAVVQAGQVVGYVGNSGTPDHVFDPGTPTEMHLHFEIRVGDSYFGAGLPSTEVRALLEQAFSSP